CVRCPLCAHQRHEGGHRTRSQMGQAEVAVCAINLCPRDGTRTEERHCVSLEVLLCADRQYIIGTATNPCMSPAQKCENRVRVLADRPLPPLRQLRVPNELEPTQGSDKRKDKAGFGGRPFWLQRLLHRNDEGR